MNHSISISVVIPTFNREKTIKNCLDSVLSQTFSPMEIIVVDDGSSDNTKEIIDNYSDERLRYTALQGNMGAQAARNRGIKDACGSWIAFQDSDDLWLDNKLEKQVDALSEVNFDPLTVIYTNSMQVDIDSKKKYCKNKPIINGDSAYTSLLTNFGPMFQGMLVSKIALQKIGYLDENIQSWQEWDTSIRLAKYCRFIYVDEPLFVYYRHKTGTISSDRKKDISGYHYVIYKFEKDIKRYCGNEIWEKHLIYLFKNCLDLRLWHDAFYYFKRISKKKTTLRITFNHLFNRFVNQTSNNVITCR